MMRGHQVGDHYFAHESEIHQVPEESHLRKLFQYCDVDCVFDVGANFGQYAQMLRNAVGYRGRIISFEPIPAAVAALRKQAAGDPLWVVVEGALSSVDGEQEFNIMEGSEFSSLSKPTHEDVALFRDQNRIAETVLVRTETLATAFHRLQTQYGFKRPFLKLDTQAHDVEIVSHGKSVMPQFVAFQSELSIRRIYSDSVDFRDALRVYEECGFVLSALVPNNAGHFPQLVEIDCIMVRKDLIPKVV